MELDVSLVDQMYAVLLPVIIFLVVYFRRRCVYDLHNSILGNHILLLVDSFSKKHVARFLFG